MVLAEKAGALRVETVDGDDEFAAVRNLRSTSGQVAFAAPVSEMLAPWRQSALATLLLLGSTALALVGATALTCCNCAARDCARGPRRSPRAHVDLALNRGRCGLWNWDLARGRRRMVEVDVRNARPAAVRRAIFRSASCRR